MIPPEIIDPAAPSASEFESGSFDLVVSYLTLVDIADFRTAVGEMTRVLKPGGSLLIANLTGFASAGAAQGWVKDAAGRSMHFPVDNYLEEAAFWFEMGGNSHRELAPAAGGLHGNFPEVRLAAQVFRGTQFGVRRRATPGAFSARAMVCRDGMAASRRCLMRT